MKESVKKYKIYANFVPVTGGSINNATSSSGQTISYQIKHSDGNVYSFPESDFFINVSLFKNVYINDYVSIDKQENIRSIQRQRINPFFIEYSFFDSIKRNKINSGNDLTQEHVNFIRDRRPDINSSFPPNQTFNYRGQMIDGDERIKRWFDLSGKNELPWNEGTENEVTINDLDKVVTNITNIVSKADYFNININR